MYSCVYSGHILFTIVKMAIGHPHSRSRSTPRWGSLPAGSRAWERAMKERDRLTRHSNITLIWHDTENTKTACIWAGSRESWRLSPRVNHSQRTTRESASRISSASANETNESNESGERGQFVHFKESFVRTDSFANEPSLLSSTGWAGWVREGAFIYFFLF